MNSILKVYWVRLSIRSLHPLHNSTLMFVYQNQMYNKVKSGQYSFSSSQYIKNNPKYKYTQMKGFKQPQQYDTPSVIKKDLIDTYKIYNNDTSQKNNTDFKTEHSVFINKNNGLFREEDFLINFDDLNLPDQIKEVLIRENYTQPTPIQSVAIPYALRGDDMINLAKTGSGKTLAFIIPVILHIMNQPSTRFPRALVLAPTRELAMQIQSQFELFSNMIVSVCVYGGHPKGVQKNQLLQKNDVIIATPGRLLDFIEDGYPISTITQLVLDEADRMLDMGFEPQIRKILTNIRPDRQTLFFSATWPIEVEQLANEICQQNPSLIRIGSDGTTLNKDIKQTITVVDHNQKKSKFREILYDYKNTQKKVLVFCERKSDTSKVEDIVKRMGISVTSLHGDLAQKDRDFRMKQYKNGEVQVLVATNLASRGLDIQDIELVINYDFPDTIEDYIHRIGRTGRAGKTGNAISIITHKRTKKNVLYELIKVLEETNQEVSQSLVNLAFD